MACSGRINIFNTSNRCLSSILLWKHRDLDKVTTDPVFRRSSDRYILHRWLHSDSLLMEWLLWTFPSTSLLFYWCVLRCMLHFGCQTVYQKTNSITLSRRYLVPTSSTFVLINCNICQPKAHFFQCLFWPWHLQVAAYVLRSLDGVVEVVQHEGVITLLVLSISRARFASHFESLTWSKSLINSHYFNPVHTKCFLSTKLLTGNYLPAMDS